MSNSKTPAKAIVLKIEENSYEVKFPNNGQFINMEVKKSLLSNGQYDSLGFDTGYGSDARDFIDMICTFSVLCPQLLSDMNVKNFLDLDMIETKKLYNQVYKKQFLPWYNQWLKILRELDFEEESDGNNVVV